MNVRYFTTPEGDEMAVLPRAEFEALSETAEHSGAMTQYLSGGLTGLTPEETRAYVAAASPLAFWRKKRGFSQTSLAAELGIAQNYVSDIENGKRSGPVELWLKLSRTLQVPLEALVDED